MELRAWMASTRTRVSAPPLLRVLTAIRTLTSVPYDRACAKTEPHVPTLTVDIRVFVSTAGRVPIAPRTLTIALEPPVSMVPLATTELEASFVNVLQVIEKSACYNIIQNFLIPDPNSNCVASA